MVTARMFSEKKKKHHGHTQMSLPSAQTRNVSCWHRSPNKGLLLLPSVHHCPHLSSELEHEERTEELTGQHDAGSRSSKSARYVRQASPCCQDNCVAQETPFFQKKKKKKKSHIDRRCGIGCAPGRACSASELLVFFWSSSALNNPTCSVFFLQYIYFFSFPCTSSSSSSSSVVKKASMLLAFFILFFFHATSGCISSVSLLSPRFRP